MPRILIIGVVAGLFAGLLVGGFHNLFTVPVIERAIEVEEARSASLNPNATEEKGLVPLGAQRWGMAAGTANSNNNHHLLAAIGCAFVVIVSLVMYASNFGALYKLSLIHI